MGFNAVLLVDDDTQVLTAWARRFRTLGYRTDRDAALNVRTANSLAKARRAFEDRQPDLLVTDVFLSDGVGTDLVRDVRAAGANTVIVLISGEERIAIREGYDAGADQVLCKPLSIDAILARHERGGPAQETLDSVTAARRHRLDVLADCNGNVSQAARLLGITRQALQLWIRSQETDRREPIPAHRG